MNYNINGHLDLMSSEEYLRYACDKIVILNQHITKLWGNPEVHPKLTIKNKLKFRDFFNEAKYLSEDIIFLDNNDQMVDKDSLDSIVKEILDLMKLARSIVDIVRDILKKD